MKSVFDDQCEIDRENWAVTLLVRHHHAMLGVERVIPNIISSGIDRRIIDVYDFLPASADGDCLNCINMMQLPQKVALALAQLGNATETGRIRSSEDLDIASARLINPGRTITYVSSKEQIAQLLEHIRQQVEQQKSKPFDFCYAGSEKKGSIGHNCITWAKAQLKTIGINCDHWCATYLNTCLGAVPETNLKYMRSWCSIA